MFAAEVFTRLTVGQTFSRSFAIFLERWDLFLLVASVVYIPFFLFMVTYSSALGEATVASIEKATNGEYDPDYDPMEEAFNQMFVTLQGSMGKLAAESTFLNLVGILGTAAVAITVAEMYAERMPNAFESGKKGLSQYCDLFCAGFLVQCAFAVLLVLAITVMFLCYSSQNSFLIFLGILVCIGVFMVIIFIAVAMMIVAPTIMVEKLGPVQAVKRCWELAYNNRCYIFCTSYCLSLVNGFATSIWGGIFFGGNPMAQFTPFGALIMSLPFLIFFPANAM